MTFKDFIEALKIFNINGINNIRFTFMSNFWFALLAGGAFVFTIMSVRDQMDNIITEEQDVL